MNIVDKLELRDGIASYRPHGPSSLTAAVDLIALAIGRCRDREIGKLLVNATGLSGIAVPSLVDRFLAVEEWASAADGVVIVALVAHTEHIDPNRFGVKVAAHFGLICDVFTAEAEALAWLELVNGAP